MFRGLEQYKEHAAFGKPIRAILDPYLPLMQQAGIDPVQQIGNLVRAHATLATGTPQQKLDLIQTLIRDYRVEVPGDPSEAPYVDPAVANLQRELDGVKSQLSERQQAEMRTVQAEHNRKIDAFAADAKNVHFAEVGHDMAALISKGVCNTLEDAYERAVWANPVTRGKEVARQQAEATAKTEKETAERAEAARKATAANVKSKSRTGSPTAAVGSMDDTLNETLAAIKARG